MKINWNEESTKRGAVMFGGFITAIIFYAFGKDPMPIMLATGSLAGGLGLTRPDNTA